jgi:predicted transcriptional regulator
MTMSALCKGTFLLRRGRLSSDNNHLKRREKFMNFFENRKLIGKNLSSYIVLNGYCKSSFSKLVGISRPTLYRILRGESPDPKRYKEQIEIITDVLDLPANYFLEY